MNEQRVERVETIELDGCQLRRVVRNGPRKPSCAGPATSSTGTKRSAPSTAGSATSTRARPTIPDRVRVHYTLGTRVGSIALELGQSAEYLAYEEHFPFGRTAFIAGDAAREVRLRTLRFVGKEQDDSTGFYVFQHRYYAPVHRQLGQPPTPPARSTAPTATPTSTTTPSTKPTPTG